jgi:hypothetical protein
LGDDNEEDKMGEVCSTFGKDENVILSEKLSWRDEVENPCVDERMT